MPDIETCNAAELEALWRERGSGFTVATLKQTKVSLERLRIAPKVFQPRDDEEESWVKEKHIGNLADAPKAGTPLDPITVFPVAGMFVVVDGHCRLKAYQEAGWSGKVPVEILSGDFLAARLHAGEANAKDKLPLTKAEKLQMAWRLVLDYEGRETELSTRQLERTGLVRHSTVCNMRKKLRESPKGSPGDPRGKTWRDVVWGEREGRDFDDDWRERAVREYAEKLRSAFGKKLDSTADIVLDSFELASKRLHDEVMERAAVKYAEEVLNRAEYIAAEAREADF